MREIPKYVPAWLIIASLLLTFVTLAHALALNIRDDTTFNNDDINIDFGSKDRPKSENETEWDISGIADTLGSLLIGLDLPFPFSLIVLIFNSIMIVVIAFCVSEIIKAWIPIL